jgi:hypothetical protein
MAQSLTAGARSVGLPRTAGYALMKQKPAVPFLDGGPYAKPEGVPPNYGLGYDAYAPRARTFQGMPMVSRERLTCDCGGELPRPLPRICPHCGGQIVGVRRRWWALALPLLLVLSMFASLAAFVWWLTGSQ